jgi:Rrf2 family protein
MKRLRLGGEGKCGGQDNGRRGNQGSSAMANLIRFSEGANLALHATMLLAGNPAQPQDTATLAETLGASSAHLSKVLQRLQRAGMVHSVRGPKGGFTLARKAEDITLLSIYEVIEGRLDVRTCLLDRPVCQAGKCIFGDFLSSARREFRALLDQTTLANIASSQGIVASERVPKRKQK